MTGETGKIQYRGWRVIDSDTSGRGAIPLLLFYTSYYMNEVYDKSNIQRRVRAKI